MKLYIPFSFVSLLHFFFFQITDVVAKQINDSKQAICYMKPNASSKQMFDGPKTKKSTANADKVKYVQTQLPQSKFE